MATIKAKKNKKMTSKKVKFKDKTDDGDETS